MSYDNAMKGVLFKDEARKSDKHPLYTGSATIDGVEYFMDAWVNKSDKTGKSFMSLKFKAKDKQPGTKGTGPGTKNPPKTGTGFDDMDDDIPF